MGRYLFRLPDVGEGVAEAEIVVWHVKPGDTVKEDQSLVDVMSDKATVDMTSPVDGIVTAIHGDIGSMLPVGSVLIELEVEGVGNAAAIAEEPAAPAPSVSAEPSPPVTDPLPTPAPAPAQMEGSAPLRRPAAAAFATRAEGDAPLASPATRARAFERGVPLQFVPGTGPGGRITADDLDAYLESDGAVSGGDPRYIAREGVQDTQIIGLRRKIAEKMQRPVPSPAFVLRRAVALHPLARALPCRC